MGAMLSAISQGLLPKMTQVDYNTIMLYNPMITMESERERDLMNEFLLTNFKASTGQTL